MLNKIKIVKKLKKFLRIHPIFTEECQVMYLLVEIRKVLDQNKKSRYPILRFYCDWSVHAEKNRITKEIKKIMVDIYHNVKREIQKPMSRSSKAKTNDFIYMKDLRVEMKKFLHEYKLLGLFTPDGNNWLEFIKLLVKILTEQPIRKPCSYIKMFEFLPATEGCVWFRVDFVKKISGNDYYELGNGY